MTRIHLNVTSEFERDLQQYVRFRGIGSKSAAIRQALREAAARSGAGDQYDFRSWLGLGLKAPLRRKRHFRTEDVLWS